MNERIKKLAEQAGYEPDMFGIGHWNMPEFKKFTELIVRDTLDQVNEFSRLTKAYQKEGIDPEFDVTKEVLKNFGFTRFPIGVE